LTISKGNGPSGRNLKVRVETRDKRSVSSAEWLERQLNDPYVAEARKLGYRSRAAFKLLQLDQKFHLLRPGLRVADLGAAPGGWMQVTVPKVKSLEGKGRVVGIDLLAIDSLDGAEILQGDMLDPKAGERVKELLGGKADLVLSDMAASTTGHKRTDHLRTIALAEAACDFACEILAPNGAFVVKLFQGGAEKQLLDLIKGRFASVKHAKPAASRAESSELYLVAQGFGGT
jgi:23S rRNA (uridine2552-2'-O)-methyltransferase